MLDTHVLIWSLAGELGRLGPEARRALSDPDAQVVVSAVVIWEIAIKRGLGKLEAPVDLLDRLKKAGVEFMSVTPEHADRVASLPNLHRDPFDRLLIAQALEGGYTVVTRDAAFAAYGVAVLVA